MKQVLLLLPIGLAGVLPAQGLMAPEERKTAEETLRKLTKEVEDLERDHRVIVSPWFRAHFGAISVTPYTLNESNSPPKWRLEKSSGGTGWYAELDFHHRQAWLREEERYEPAPDQSAMVRALIPDDHEIRLRFANAAEQNSAAAAAGGDIQVEASVGWSIKNFSLESDPQIDDGITELKPAGSITIELSGGVSTDRDNIDAHRYIQAGLGSAWSFAIPLADRTYRRGTAFLGLYGGVHPFPSVQEDDGIYTLTERPHYNDLGAIGVRVDFTLPMSQSIELVAGARYFTPMSSDDTPDDWQVFVGISLPLDRLVSDLDGSSN